MPRGRVGVSPGYGLTYASPRTLRREMVAMRTLGVRRIRLDVGWAQVEAEPGTFDWSRTDRLLNAADRAGLRTLAVVGYEPRWARRVDGDGQVAPLDAAAFARFAGRAAKRYAAKVRAWEIWNEPNTRRSWGRPVDAADYARLVAAVAPVLRSHDPRATIVVGALSPAVDAVDGSEQSPSTFLKAFYETDPDLSTFDAVSVHPYCYPALPTGVEPWNTFAALPELHDLMAARGDGRTRLWLTEFGAPTGTSESAVTESRQVSTLVSGLRSAAQLTFVGPLYIYSLRDAGTDLSDPEDNFGVTMHDGRAKPAFWALQRELRKG